MREGTISKGSIQRSCECYLGSQRVNLELADKYDSPHSIFKSSQTNTVSPLLAALPNPSELFARSFLSASPGTSSTTPNSITGGSPPSSWPASYTNHGSLPRGLGGSVPRNGGYPSFEEHLSKNGAFMANRQIGSSGDTGRLRPGDASYACSFDSLDGDSENVLCLGWEGGLDVWRIGKGSLDLLGRLEGLTGGVRSAKVCKLLKPYHWYLIDIYYRYYPLLHVVIP